MVEEPVIWVVAETEAVTQSKAIDGMRDGHRDIGGQYGSPDPTETVTRILPRKRVPLDAQALKAQMDGLLKVVGDLFVQAEQQTGMQLDEVALSVEINAEGQVSLVGNGGKLGSTGGITLKFSRPKT